MEETEQQRREEEEDKEEELEESCSGEVKCAEERKTRLSITYLVQIPEACFNTEPHK